MKILTTADWHLRHQRLDDTLHCLGVLRKDAGKHKPDVILHGGDVFDSPHPPDDLRTRAAEKLVALSRIAPTVVVPGNHDGDALADWGELPTGDLLIVTEPRIIEFYTCKVFAVPWLTPKNVLKFGESASKRQADFGRAVEMLIALAANRFREEYEAGDTRTRILLAHASVLGGQMGEHKPAVLGRDLIWPTSWFDGFDLGVLGHFHKAQMAATQPCAVIYPGSPGRLSFNERDEEKAYCLATLDGKNVPSLEFLALPARPMVQLEGCLEDLDLDSVPDEAILKLRLKLSPDEPCPHIENRWHTLKVEVVRPENGKREVRLEKDAIRQSPQGLLETWLSMEGVEDKERIVVKAHEIMRGEVSR